MNEEEYRRYFTRYDEVINLRKPQANVYDQEWGRLVNQWAIYKQCVEGYYKAQKFPDIAVESAQRDIELQKEELRDKQDRVKKASATMQSPLLITQIQKYNREIANLKFKLSPKGQREQIDFWKHRAEEELRFAEEKLREQMRKLDKVFGF